VGRERPRGYCATHKAEKFAPPHIRTQTQGPALYRLKRAL
jgi:hypothetical protein